MTAHMDDVELYGPELIEAAQRWAQPVVAQHVGKLERRINQLQAESARGRVMATLDGDPQLGGKWRALNEDPGFLAWVGQKHEFSGRPLVELMRDAFDRGDAHRVAHFFSAYLAGQLPARQRTAERLPLEARHNTTLRSADLAPRRSWRREEIAAFYRDVAAGKYDNDEAEKLRIEREIVAAARERRIANPPLQPDYLRGA
jgi:hypothetical protein